MDRANSENAWLFTSELMATIYNTVRDSKVRAPFTGADFNPFELAKRKKKGSSLRDFASCIPDPKARAAALKKLDERERRLNGS